MRASNQRVQADGRDGAQFVRHGLRRESGAVPPPAAEPPGVRGAADKAAQLMG